MDEPRLCRAAEIETLLGEDERRIAEMQPSVWMLPFLMTIQIVSFNFPDAKARDPKRGRRYKEQYAKWLVHTGLVLPSYRHRRAFRGALEGILGVSSPQGDYIDAMGAALIKAGHLESRCRFSRLCHTLACRLHRGAAEEAGGLFREQRDYDRVRNLCESCRARCLNVVEKEANAKEGKENGCDHEKQGRRRLKTVVRFLPGAPRECLRYIEPRRRYDCYDSPDGMQTPVWGPILWSLIHVVSFAVRGSGKELSNHLCWLVETSRVLPCRYCRDNFFTNLRHALWRMGGEQQEWRHVADAILAWQIVQRVEAAGEGGGAVPPRGELDKAFCLQEGEVTEAHVKAATSILAARARGARPDASLDWYRLLFEALRGEVARGDEDAFGRLCFEVHSTVNQMLQKQSPSPGFDEVRRRYAGFRGEGSAWHVELQLEAREEEEVVG